jgi:hypothetical protein
MKPNTIVIAPLIGVTLSKPINSVIPGATVTRTTENIGGVETTTTNIETKGTPPLPLFIDLLFGKTG